MPFFSIIIPTYNRSNLISRAINSVLVQKFSNFEIIIVDDGSSDNTNEIVKGFSDNRVKYFDQSNRGVCVARNLGASKALGEYLVFLDSDDFVCVNWLEEIYYAADNRPDLVFCYANLIDDLTGEVRSINSFNRSRTKTGTIAYSSLAGTYFIKRKLFYQSRGFNENLKYSENTELINRVLFEFHPTTEYVRMPLVKLGNSLDPKTRHGKFKQVIMKQSLAEIISLNLEYWKYNQKQLIPIVRRLILANVVLKDYDSAFSLLKRYFRYAPLRFLKIALLIMVSPIYRMYLLSLGYRE